MMHVCIPSLIMLFQFIFNPRPLRPEGSCRHLRLSVHLSVHPRVPILLVNTPVTPANRHETDKKTQIFQSIGQLSATDNVAEDTVKPVGFHVGVISGKIQYGITQFETDR